jgi:uncharacterized protein
MISGIASPTFTPHHRLLPSGRKGLAYVFQIWLFACLLGLGSLITARAEVPVPDLTHRVTDLTGTLSTTDIQQLEGKLADLEARKGSQIAVLLIPSLEGEDIAAFGIRVADKWKVGRKRVDDGVILIVAKNDRKMRIEVGYGLEGAIPDAISKRVIDEIITPKFREGDFAGGINAGVDQLIGLINGEPLPEPARRSGGNAANIGSAFIFSLIGGVIGGAILSTLIGRTGGSLLGAVGAGVGGWLLSGVLMLGIFNAFIVLSMLGGLGRGAGWSSRGGGWGGGGFGGGGFGGGGGSWGGGGGGFGGGGSSGSW